MAISSTIEYCTDSDVYQVYPGINAVDGKTRLYGTWVAHGSTANLYEMYNTGYVDVLYKDGQDLGSEHTTTPGSDNQWLYVEADDKIQLFLQSTDVATLNASIWEAGVDFQTLLQNARRNASRYLESRIDYRTAKEISKDREGNYPFVVIRCTALIAAVLLIKAHTTPEEGGIVDTFEEEIDNIIDGINTGKITLTHQVTMDSSKGVIRDIVYTQGTSPNTGLRPIELRGRALSLRGYDLIKLKVIAGGVLGTATYSVFVKDGNKLKSTEVLTAEKINGDFQDLAYGLEVRFAGGTDASVATADDEFEIEVYSSGMDATVSEVNTMTQTRGGYGIAVKRSLRI
tara:strand:- start:8701 stop:9729 length:1029 start_codon:yes stop_codon:yes gene_type:complete